MSLVRLSPLFQGILLPTGRSLPPESWNRRHRMILLLLGFHAAALGGSALYRGFGWAHAILEGGVVAAFAFAAASPRLDRRARSTLASLGLMSSSAILTHLSGGYIEAHFHFFVMLGVIFLYEDWLPYVLSVAYVAVHHGVVGTIDPLSVYNHPGAIERPWIWAGVHAVFILGLSAALMIAWNVIERARTSETRALSETQELKRQLLTQEKLAALGSLVAGLAHEVRTPLTVVSTNASLLHAAAKKDPGRLASRVLESSAEIQANVDRINALVLQLRRFHGIAPDEMEVCALDPVVRDALGLYASANGSSRRIEVDLQPTPPARIQILGLHQVVLNLVINAVDATDPEHGIVTVRTRSEAGSAALIVEDNGVGIGEELSKRVFDPLFTTKKDGMGLGLHIVRRIVEAHGGTVGFTSCAGTTRFEVRIPIAALPSRSNRETSAPLALESGVEATPAQI